MGSPNVTTVSTAGPNTSSNPFQSRADVMVINATAAQNTAALNAGLPFPQGSIIIDNTTTPPTILGISDGAGNLNAGQSNGVTYNSTTGAMSAGGNPVFRPLVAKIKASMAGAAGNNPVELAPWIAAPAWVTSTAYGYGQVVSSDTAPVKDYICTDSNGGTSGATAPTGTSASVVSDGTLHWLYLRTHEVAAPAYDTPAVTISGTLTGLTKTISSVLSSAPHPSFGAFGGIPFVAGTGVYYASLFQGSGGNLSGLGGTYGTAAYYQQAITIDFWTDAPKISLYPYGGAAPYTPVAIEVNNRRLQPGATVNGAAVGGANYILDWTGTAALGRAERRIKMKLWGLQDFISVNTDALSTVWYPQNPNRFKIFVEGDSLSAGAPSTGTNVAPVAPNLFWTDQFANLIGCDNIVNGAVNGTGFIAVGSYNTYLARVPFMALQQPDVVMVMGCYNDFGYTSNQRQAAVLQYLQAVRAALPKAIIIIFGTWPNNASGVIASTWPAAPAANATTLVTADADMQAAVSAFNDNGTFFYSQVNDPAGSWCYGTGQTSGTTGNGNSDLYTSSQLPHATQQGYDYYARRLANAFKSIINAIN